MRGDDLRFCPRCFRNTPFLPRGRVRVGRAIADLVLGWVTEDDTGIAWRDVRCEHCDLPSREAARTAFPT